MKSKPSSEKEPPVPAVYDWRTTDEDELNRRRQRAIDEQPVILNQNSAERIFSNFQVKSPSGLVYDVEIRDLKERDFSCSCVDFQINGLGSCKHVEAVLLHLQARFPKLYAAASREGSSLIEVGPDRDRGKLRVARGILRLPRKVHALFDDDGRQTAGSVDDALARLRAWNLPGLRLSQEIEPWLESRRREVERKRLRREYEEKVQSGIYPQNETLVPLFPYQREGMLHLAFTERALLADEMGLGKTIQAIAACALLHRLGKAQRALIVSPASLKTEWEEQIQKFTRLPYQVVYGGKAARLIAYDTAPFFTLVNYEQMVPDALDVNERLKPDIIVLDEAQRIKNWSTKTARSIKRLQSRYAFVLTGTPIENRIDEIFSLFGFLDPAIFGSLFRFNREFYQLNDRGRPEEYQNLERLQERIRPLMLRRRKSDVESELPSRTDRFYFVPLSHEQRQTYADHEAQVARLAAIAKRHPLTKQQQDKLMRELAMMRMICDTNYILDPDDRICPKLDELGPILEEVCADPEVKVIIFSEWERMLELVRDLCKKLKLGYAWHTGKVPQRRRRAEIMLFKTDPACRIFLSTESGGTGLNLQNASVVINCDLPWNPAKLEQRIARAWRKNQPRNVTVINLVSENTIEHRMVETLQVKQGLADGVLDARGDLSQIRLRTGGQNFLSRLEHMLDQRPPAAPPDQRKPPLPVNRSAAFAEQARKLLDHRLVACEERYPIDLPHSVLVVVVDRDAELWREKLRDAHTQLFGPGTMDPLAPVQLEVIDRATAGALKRLADAGLIANNIRATRRLHPPAEPAAALSAETLTRITEHAEKAARKLKMARLLIGGDLAEEARPGLQEAILLLAQAVAIRGRLNEPKSIEEAFVPPLAHLFGESLAPLQAFASGASAELAIEAVAAALPKLAIL